MDSKLKQRRLYILGLSLIGLLILFGAIRNYYRANALEGKKGVAIAIITDINSGRGVRQSASVDYNYIINGEKFSDHDNGDFNFMKIGDTLLIEYSNDHPSISQVRDKYYMKKYQYLKNRDQ